MTITALRQVLQLLNAFIQEAEEVRNSEIFLSDIIQNVVDIMRKADGKVWLVVVPALLPAILCPCLKELQFIDAVLHQARFLKSFFMHLFNSVG